MLSQIVILYILNLYNVICQYCLNRLENGKYLIPLNDTFKLIKMLNFMF